MDCKLHLNLFTASLHHKWCQGLLLGIFALGQGYFAQPSTAQNLPSAEYCHVPPAEVIAKNTFRLAAQKGDAQSQVKYDALVKKHFSPGALEEIFDRMVDKGYNQVYIATFYGKVLLPRTGNGTVWNSALNTRGTDKTDLLAESIQKGHDRGLKVYAWMYSLNFGPEYGITPEGQSAVAINGRGETTMFAGEEGFQKSSPDGVNADVSSVLFVDPYSDKARDDYARLVKQVINRHPDGVLFDYIRFPRGQASQSIAGRVRDLWIYGDESRQTLAALGQNNKGSALIDLYLNKGDISVKDLQEIDRLYPEDMYPLWKGRTPLENEATMPYEEKLPWIEWDLWQLVLAHASDGVVSFFQAAVTPVEQQKIKSGAVFFPEANQAIGKRGYDSRLQAWDRFSTNEWHPMSYATCNQSNCIVDQVRRVIGFAPAGTDVVPALAGTWSKPLEGRPSLESQMDGIHRSLPQIHSISHFAFSWQEPELDYYRGSCQLK
jgi:hypothetical protein